MASERIAQGKIRPSGKTLLRKAFIDGENFCVGGKPCSFHAQVVDEGFVVHIQARMAYCFHLAKISPKNSNIFGKKIANTQSTSLARSKSARGLSQVSIEASDAFK